MTNTDSIRRTSQKAKGKTQKAKGKTQKAKGKSQKAKGRWQSASKGCGHPGKAFRGSTFAFCALRFAF
jgi:hypothetical protein